MVLRLVAALLALSALAGCRGPDLERWHTARLQREFRASQADTVRGLDAYLRLEAELFEELDADVYAHTSRGHGHALERYSAGSAADPRSRAPDWNRTIELVPEGEPVGGALLLHGMSDSPYSLRALALALRRSGYLVLALRLPGHGTAPSGLKHVSADDMVAATRLGMRHLSAALGERPIHVVGYSTGASLAIDYALDAAEGAVAPAPASLVLVSPAIRIHHAARLAGFKNAMSALPGLERLAWLSVMPEFDPFKYNSFATNAGAVVNGLTRSVDRRIARHAKSRGDALPPILVFKSTVDATVTTDAIVDTLLARLSPDRHELVLFDVNRRAAVSKAMVNDPGPLTDRLLADERLPFTVTFVTNESTASRGVVALVKPPFSGEPTQAEPLDLEWPRGVLSLSHVALAFPPDDPLYGETAPVDPDELFLGDLALRSERGVLALSPGWLLRMRHNPFYDYVERRALGWMENAEHVGTQGAGDGGG